MKLMIRTGRLISAGWGKHVCYKDNRMVLISELVFVRVFFPSVVIEVFLELLF